MVRRRPLLDPMEANYGLDFSTCAEQESDKAVAEDRLADESIGDLSGGGGGANLTRREASARAAAHLKKFPGHRLNWNALGGIGGA